MANVLPLKVRARVVRSLVEGNSIRSAARLTKTNKDAVMYLGATVGEGCRRLHDKLVRHVPAGSLEIDEVWSLVGRHERRKLKSDPTAFGDRYTMFAMDSDTKLVPSYETGKRTLPTATAFMSDLRSRIDGKPQITFDGWPHWIEATRRTFGHRGADVGSTVKEYQKECRPDDTARGCGRVKSQTKTVIYGNPDQSRISTSKAERLNLTSRMTDRRFTRLTNAFSRKAENHDASAHLHYFWYNFVRPHESLGTTPAVKAGIADHEWTIEEMTKAALAEMGVENPDPKGPRRYQRKTHAQDVGAPVTTAPAPVAPSKTVDKPEPKGRKARAQDTVVRKVSRARRAGQDDQEEAIVAVPSTVSPPNDEAPPEIPTSPVSKPDRDGERGFVTLGALAHVGLAAVGVLVVRPLDDAVRLEVFGRAVPASGLALGVAVGGALLAHVDGHRKLATAAASLVAGLGTGMLARAATRRLLAPASAALSAPWWRRALRWMFG